MKRVVWGAQLSTERESEKGGGIEKRKGKDSLSPANKERKKKNSHRLEAVEQDGKRLAKGGDTED